MNERHDPRDWKCQFCGSTGHTVGGPKYGTPFASLKQLAQHERMCRENPNRTVYHRGKRRQRVHQGKELILRVIKEYADKSLLCHNGQGEFYKAKRVHDPFESEAKGGS